MRIVSHLVITFFPLISAYFLREITNIVVIKDIEQLKKYFLLFLLFQILVLIIGRINQYITMLHSDMISNVVSKKILEIISHTEMACFDNCEFYNELSNITRDKDAIAQYLWSFLSLLQSGIQLVSLTFCLTIIDWWVPIILFLISTPSIILDKKYTLALYNFSVSSISEVRKQNYIFNILTKKDCFKDIKTNNLSNYLIHKYTEFWNIWFEQKRKTVKSYFNLTTITILLPNLVGTYILILVIQRILSGDSSIGDLSFYFGIINQFSSVTQITMKSVSDIIEKSLIITYLDNFKKWIIPEKRAEIDNCNFNFESIEFINVSFKYPNTDYYALKNVSLKISSNCRIGIVGKNGSGKTTLIKLILGLYKPTEGSILLNGKNINEYNPKSVSTLFSVMFQDYINYAFSFKENIHTGDINSIMDSNRIIEASKKSGAYEFIRYWKNGIDTYLTKSFDNSGEELSGGQWQKVSLTKFFYKKAPIYIMDEPSATLDVESESQIFNSIFKEISESTIILISHRLKNLSMMDTIIVMNHGQICEMGSHEQLLKRKGLYNSLFELEVKNYH